VRAATELRLLLIDDDVELCGLIQEFLGRHGLALECQHDGPSGLVRVLDRRHHLVLLDVMLPGLDGLEVLRQIRRRSHVPVIMLTARVDRTDRIAGLDAGADDYLPKPFGPDELVARVRAVLRRSGLPPVVRPRPLTSNGLTLEPGARRARLDGESVEVTAIEYDILEYLVRAAGRIVSRDELSSVVCQRELSPLDRSLDVHISHLRKKLEGRRALIRTVRGAGYLFCVEADAS